MRIMRSLVTLAAGLVAFLIGALPALAQQAVPRFERGDCPFPAGDWAATVRLECGYLFVYRVRERPTDGTLKLAVAIVHPLAQSKGPPIVLPHGGPSGPGGLRGGEMAAASRWAPLLERDFVVYDLRGAGLSEPPLCVPPETAEPVRNLRGTVRQQAYNDGARSCAADLKARGFDPASFSTPINAADLIDLRKTLGYQTWDVFGVSYGTRVAQEVMRRDPQAVRSVVLLAPVIPGPSQEAEAPLNYQRVMDHVFDVCAKQPSCAQAFPTLRKDFEEVHKELSAHPLEIPLETSAGTSSVTLDGERFLRSLYGRFAQRLAHLPLIVSELRRGDRMEAGRALAGYSSSAPPGGNTLTNLVGCFESGGPTVYRDVIADVTARTQPLYKIMVNTEEECPYLQERFATESDRAPVTSDIPTLILAQEFDDRTPLSFARRIAAHLTNAYVFGVPGQTHCQRPTPCTQAMIFSFLANPKQKPNGACLDSMPQVTFDTRNLAPVTLTFAIAPTGPFAGQWEGNFPEAPVAYRFDLKINGSDVSGTLAAGVQQVAIFDGRIDGDAIAFKLKSPDGDRTISFAGKLSGNAIRFTRSVEVRPAGNPGGAALYGATGARTFVVKRAR